jgi:hypothetical protein
MKKYDDNKRVTLFQGWRKVSAREQVIVREYHWLNHIVDIFGKAVCNFYASVQDGRSVMFYSSTISSLWRKDTTKSWRMETSNTNMNQNVNFLSIHSHCWSMISTVCVCSFPLSPHNTLRNLFIISFFLLCCFLLFVEFSIITENKTYFFAAKNMQEKENWIHDLETVIKCSPKWLGIYYLRPNQTNICINFVVVVVVVVEWVMICVGRYIVHIPLNKGTWNSESRDGFFRVMFSHLP